MKYVKKTVLFGMTLLIATQALAFIDIFKPKEKKYSFSDVSVDLICDSGSEDYQKGDEFYVLGSINEVGAKKEIFTQINGKLSLMKNTKTKKTSDSISFYDGSFLTYNFDLRSRTMIIVNNNNVVVTKVLCHR